EAESPGALGNNKRLDPGFLAEALELAEEEAFVRPEQRQALRERLTRTLLADFDALRTALEARDYDAAAVRYHEAHYHKKALADLEVRS
ncbi:MAG: hypothetical protein KC620_26875, partial [Myxococcales bacterium]|nr:hypothetical protein [Myxococcales bacterium]